MTNLNLDTHESWKEWVVLTQAVATDTCMRCAGWGDNGFEEQSGFLLICYCCGGTGKHYSFQGAA